MKNLENLKKNIKEKKVMESVVRLTCHDKILDTDILVVDLDGNKGIIPRDEVDVQDTKISLVNFVGRKIKFYIKEIDEENDLIICSRKDFKFDEREKLIERLEVGETFKAKITKILNFGAYVNIQGVTALIRNTDFANDYITIKELKKEGDVIDVKLNKISKNRQISVESVDKVKVPTIMSLDLFEPFNVVKGTIKNINPNACYVCIAPGLDALCPVPDKFDIEEGMNVIFKIKQVNKETDEAVLSGKKRKGVRGSIIRIIHDEDTLDNIEED